MSDRMLVATRKGLFTLDHKRGAGESRWEISRAAFLGDPVSMVLHDSRDGCHYASLGHGHFGVKLHRSPDGVNWEEWTTPVYPEPPAGAVEIRCPMRNVPIPWKMELIWELRAGGGDQPGRLWCGTIPGGLFRTDDGGKSWELVRPLWDNPARKHWFGGGYDFPGVHSICVHPHDPNHVTVGVSCGGVWVTQDGGETWTCRAEGMFAEYMPPDRRNDPHIQDPHSVVQCPGQPDHLWSQHHNGVFKSTDGATTWKHVANVRPSSFGFAVAVHPNDPNTAWLAPGISDEKRIPVDGKVVIARTRDGGESFDVLRDGLPQEQAYDVVFRHALDVDDTGDRLAFGSTTGSLWASDNQGDSWQQVSANLPPIYCVRFVK